MPEANPLNSQHATGIAAGKAKHAANVWRGPEATRRKAAMREAHPCKIKDCGRTAFKGDLCRAHYQLVPVDMTRAVMSEVMETSHRIAQKHHKRQLAFVRRLLEALTP